MLYKVVNLPYNPSLHRKSWYPVNKPMEIILKPMEMSHVMRKPVPYVNNKDANQPAHLHSLINTFIVHCLDSIISVLAKIQNFKALSSLCSWAGRFDFYLVANPEDRFSCDMAQLQMSQIMRKLVYALCKQQRRRSACPFAQFDQCLCCLLLR